MIAPSQLYVTIARKIAHSSSGSTPLRSSLSTVLSLLDSSAQISVLHLIYPHFSPSFSQSSLHSLTILTPIPRSLAPLLDSNLVVPRLISSTVPSSSLTPVVRVNLLGNAAKQEREDRLSRFLKTWCSISAGGVEPFFRGLWLYYACRAGEMKNDREVPKHGVSYERSMMPSFSSPGEFKCTGCN